MKKTSMQEEQTLSEALDALSTAVRVAPDLLKALAVVSDAAVRRSAVDREGLTLYWKSEQRSRFSRWSTIVLFTSFFKDFTNHRKKTNWAVAFSCRLFPKVDNFTTDETFQQSGKKDSFRHLLKRSASM